MTSYVGKYFAHGRVNENLNLWSTAFWADTGLCVPRVDIRLRFGGRLANCSGLHLDPNCNSDPQFFRFGSQIFEVPEDYDEDCPPDLGPRESIQTETETETDLDAAASPSAFPDTAAPSVSCREMETQTEAPFGEACSAETVPRQDLRDLMAKYALMRKRYAVRVRVLEEQLLAMHDVCWRPAIGCGCQCAGRSAP